MTTFHDQPPLSRRAAREQERDAQLTSPGMNYTQFLTPEQEEAARLERQRERMRENVAPGSRRAHREAGVASTAAPEAPPVETGAPAYKLRDFSPDGSMSAPPPALVEPPTGMPVALDYRTLGVSGAPHPSDAQVPVAQAPVAQAPGAQTPAPAAESPDRPLTRRELRMRELAASGHDAARDTADADAAQTPSTRSSGFADTIAQFEQLRRAQAPAGPPVAADPSEAVPTPVEEFVESFAEGFESPSEQQASEAGADDSASSEPKSAVSDPWNSLDLSAFPPPSAPSDDDRVDLPPPMFEVVAEPAASAQPGGWPLEFTQPRTPVSAPSADDEVVEAIVESDTVAEAPSLAPEFVAPEFVAPEFVAPEFDGAAFVEPPVVRESYTPPAGHWTRQAELEDDDLPFESTLSREVGGGSSTTTTSALILPAIPQPDFSSIINATGEILITGTIDLPQGLATMGAESQQLDDSSVDAMFEAADKELVSNDSQPVRAIRAVSTHTATRGVIAVPTKPPSTRWLKVAVVAACVLAVSVVAFLGVYVFTTL